MEIERDCYLKKIMSIMWENPIGPDKPVIIRQSVGKRNGAHREEGKMSLRERMETGKVYIEYGMRGGKIRTMRRSSRRGGRLARRYALTTTRPALWI